MSVKTTGKILLVAIIVLSVFTTLATYVPQVPIESVPEPILPIWEYIVAFFSLAQVLAIVGLVINISGYLTNYFKEYYGEEYDFTKLGKTLTLYIGIITGMLTTAQTLAEVLPEPYNEYVAAGISVGAAILIILDLAKKQLAELGQAIRA